MKHRREAVAVFALLCLWAPGKAFAQIPSPANSIFDGDLCIGNARGFALLPLPNLRPTLSDGYRIVVRDFANNPMPNVAVVMDFTGTGVRVHAAQTNGQIPNCPNLITAVTNVAGAAVFFPATVGVYSSATPDVRIFANGVPMINVRFRSVDLVAVPGAALSKVDGQDFNAFRMRYFSLFGESNLDPETDFATEGPSAGITDAFDLNVLRTELFCGVAGFAIQEPCTQPICN